MKKKKYVLSQFIEDYPKLYYRSDNLEIFWIYWISNIVLDYIIQKDINCIENNIVCGCFYIIGVVENCGVHEEDKFFRTNDLIFGLEL